MKSMPASETWADSTTIFLRSRSSKKADSLIAYAGLDPAVIQSGQTTGAHMHITKMRSPHLRATLYVAVINMVMSKAENMIARYVLKKKNSGLSYKAAVIPVAPSCCV